MSNPNKLVLRANLNAEAFRDYLPAGTEETPSLSFTADKNTGVYLDGTDVFGVTTRGARTMTFSPSNIVAYSTVIPSDSGVELGQASTPWSNLYTSTVHMGNAVLADGASGLDVMGNVTPTQDGVYDLGSPTHRFKSLYLTSNTLYVGDTSISESGGMLTMANVHITGNTLFLGNTTITESAGNVMLPNVYIGGDLTFPTGSLQQQLNGFHDHAFVVQETTISSFDVVIDDIVAIDNPRKAMVWLNGSKLAYLNANLTDYTVTVTPNVQTQQTTLTFATTELLYMGDIVDTVIMYRWV